MRIAFISDNHLGYNWRDKELRMDSIRQAREAFQKAVDEEVDLIIHPGDIFDEKNPKPEIWMEALRIFAIPKAAPDSGVNLVKGSVSRLHMKGIPVIAIHGNHERRGNEKKTAVEALDAAGLVIYLHNRGMLFEKDGEKVFVYGMGYVPESYVLKALKLINPKKVDDAFNIFVMHQNIKEYLPDEVSFLSLADLPRFDLVVNGHIHFNDYRDYGDWRYMMPGSTVITQMKKQEAERRKGFYIFDTIKKEARFIELETQRPFIFETLEFSESEASDVVTRARDLISKVLENDFQMKPIIKIKLVGSLKAGRNVDKASIAKGFEGKAVIFVDNQLESLEFMKKIEELREIHAMKKANVNLGISILRSSLKDSGYSGPDIEDIFDLLVDGDQEDVLRAFIQHYQRISNTGTSSQ